MFPLVLFFLSLALRVGLKYVFFGFESSDLEGVLFIPCFLLEALFFWYSKGDLFELILEILFNSLEAGVLTLFFSPMDFCLVANFISIFVFEIFIFDGDLFNGFVL